MRRRAPHADPGTPDARGPGRYLWWLVTCQRGRVLLGATWGSLWMVSLMLPPWLIARAIDEGLRPRNMAALGAWTAGILAVGVLSACLGPLRHRTMSLVRLDASYRTVQVVTRHAVTPGATLPRKVSTGEVVSIQAADLGRIARTLTITGPGVGAVLAYAAVAVLLLSASWLLAVVVLLGVPLLAVALGPLLGRLQAPRPATASSRVR